MNKKMNTNMNRNKYMSKNTIIYWNMNTNTNTNDTTLTACSIKLGDLLHELEDNTLSVIV